MFAVVSAKNWSFTLYLVEKVICFWWIVVGDFRLFHRLCGVTSCSTCLFLRRGTVRFCLFSRRLDKLLSRVVDIYLFLSRVVCYLLPSRVVCYLFPSRVVCCLFSSRVVCYLLPCRVILLFLIRVMCPFFPNLVVYFLFPSLLVYDICVFLFILTIDLFCLTIV